MSKIVFALFALFALTSAASLRASVSDLELAASSNGQVALTYVPNVGYVLPVDLSRNARASQQMILSLYSSSVMFAKSCFQFKSYSCNQFDFCQVDNSKEVQTQYPYFTAKGNLLKTQLFADYSSWVLANDAPAFQATACAAPTTEAFGTNTVGILGLGFENAASKNYQTPVRSFAVFFNQGMKLVFNPKLTFPHKIISQVRTDANWRVPNVNTFKFATLQNPLTGVSLIYDINSDAIALPVPLYTAFLTQVLPKFGVACPSVYNKPVCNYNGQTQFLPNIEFIANGQTITVTPQMYALTPANGQFTLNIKGTSPQLQGVNYVTEQYQYTIILGSSVLGGFYNHFDASTSTVSHIQVL